MPVTPAAVIDGLVDGVGIVRGEHRIQGDGWAEYEVQFGASQYSALLTVSPDAEHLRGLPGSFGGSLDTSPGEHFVLELTLSGDVDWPPILAFLTQVIEQHHGQLYDDVAGFEASLT